MVLRAARPGRVHTGGMLTGLHVLVTYQCTGECDHCFLHCGPTRDAAFTLDQIDRVLDEARRLGSVSEVYFEGGEPFLFYGILVESVRRARALGMQVGIVTNAYWATSVDDAVHWLRPLADLGIADLSVSDDEFHRRDAGDRRAAFALAAARRLGMPCDGICIDPPRTDVGAGDESRGRPITGGRVRFRGRAAEKLATGVPLRPWAELTTCPYENLASPERVHVDAYGHVQLCQGLTMGNMWDVPLRDLIASYDPAAHPIVGPLLAGGPARLAERVDFEPAAGYADECHFCYSIRKSRIGRYPEWLAPRGAYGLPDE